MNQDIYYKIRSRILYLEYEPGQILNEQVLAKEFGVSRTPLREVLNRLEWEHLVRILPRTGTLVTEIDLNRIINVFRIRMETEDLLGRLATEKFSAEKLEVIEELRQNCRELMNHKDRRALSDVDIRIKNLFYEAAGNPYLTEISERFYALTFRLWYLNMDKGDWNEEVMALDGELAELLRVLPTLDPVQVGKARKSELIKHLERLRSKFLGLST